MGRASIQNQILRMVVVVVVVVAAAAAAVVTVKKTSETPSWHCCRPSDTGRATRAVRGGMARQVVSAARRHRQCAVTVLRPLRYNV